MDPVEALRSIESRLRLVISEQLGRQWLDQLANGQLGRLQSWRKAEADKRGVLVENDSLLDYTMTAELGKLIVNNWNRFSDIFKDENEFKWLMAVVQNVRNTIAHSRPLLPFERDLLSGAAGKVNHMVALHRSKAGTSESYYPLIERLRDNLGNDWMAWDGDPSTVGGRLDVGARLLIQGASTPVRGKKLIWQLWREPHGNLYGIPDRDPDDSLEGESVEFHYEVGPDDVSEKFSLAIALRTSSSYARYMKYAGVYDDVKHMQFAVNPND